MPAGHWRAFSTKGIGIDSYLLPFVRGNHPRSSDWVPDPLPGARIGSQNRVCHTFATLGSYPSSAAPPSFSTGNRSIRSVQPGSGRKKSYLACSTSIRPPKQPRSLLYIYMFDRRAQQLVEWGMRRSVSAPKGADNPDHFGTQRVCSMCSTPRDGKSAMIVSTDTHS